MNNLLWAAHKLIHDFGVKPMAAVMETRAETLRKKANPNDDGHQLTLVEIFQASVISNSPAILFALACELGYVCIPKPKAMPSSDINLFDLLLTIGQSKGNVCSALRDVLADGRVTRGEAMDLRQAIHEMQQQLSQLESDIESCVDDQLGGLK